MRFCPYAQRTKLVLEHKHLPYDVVNINLSSKPAWFLERNPVGTVPVLEKDGHVIYESTACCEWLDDVYPGHRLTPSDPWVKAKDRMLLEYFGKITSLFYIKLRKPETLEEGIEELHKHLSHYEKELSTREGPFFGGSGPSMIDFYLWPHMERMPVLARMKDLRIAVSVEKHPSLSAWYGAMQGVPAVAATMCDHDTHMAFLQGYENNKYSVDYDAGISD